MPVKQTLPNTTRMTTWKSKSSKCSANCGSAVWSEKFISRSTVEDYAPVAHIELKRDTTCGLLRCRMYQDKLASLKRQLHQLQEGNDFLSLLLKCVMMAQTDSLYVVGCVICASCGIQDTARSWLMVVFRDDIIRLGRHFLGKFNSAATVTIQRETSGETTDSLHLQMVHFE